jgi:hypothetical protein
MASKRKTAGILRRIKLPSGKTVEVLRQPPTDATMGDLDSRAALMRALEQTPAANADEPHLDGAELDADAAELIADQAEPTPDAAELPADAFGSAPDAERQAASDHAAPERADAHVCPECDSHLVYPIAWCASDEQRWSADLRCPNCERIETIELDLAAADRFDEELEQGAETLLRDLKRLAEANMLEDLERLVAALSVDALLPMDF